MKYKLTIVKEVDNPAFSQSAYESYASKDRYVGLLDYDKETMCKVKDEQALVVELTEKEFEAIKKAVLGVM